MATAQILNVSIFYEMAVDDAWGHCIISADLVHGQSQSNYQRIESTVLWMRHCLKTF